MVQTVLVCVEELATRIRVPFSTPYDQFHTYSTHAQVAISLSISGPTWRERLASDRARPRRSATTATAHTRVELIAYMRIQPLSMHNGSHSGAHEHPHDRSIMHRQHSRPRPLRTRKRGSAAPRPSPATVTSTAAATATDAAVPKLKPRCNWPLCCCSHHLQPKQPNTCVERERVDVSLRGGREASSRSHRCSPEAYPRCVAAGRHSATDTLSTLSAWRAIRQRFASRCRRMYLFLQYASSVSHRSLTATRTRTVTMSWYGWHGRAVAEPAGKGTRADERLAHEMALALVWPSCSGFLA